MNIPINSKNYNSEHKRFTCLNTKSFFNQDVPFVEAFRQLLAEKNRQNGERGKKRFLFYNKKRSHVWLEKKTNESALSVHNN